MNIKSIKLETDPMNTDDDFDDRKDVTIKNEFICDDENEPMQTIQNSLVVLTTSNHSKFDDLDEEDDDE